MSGAWGVERARCQAALAVLASLCRARPPPVGLDVQTCRSFELQTPERSPSAADAGNAKPEAPPFLDRHPNCPPSQSPTLWPREHGTERELRLQILDSQPVSASALARGPQDRRRGAKGPREERTPSPLPCDPRGPRGKLGPRDAAPLGASVSLPSLRSPCGAICPGRGLCGEQTTDIPAEDLTRLLGR